MNNQEIVSELWRKKKLALNEIKGLKRQNVNVDEAITRIKELYQYAENIDRQIWSLMKKDWEKRNEDKRDR